MVSDTKLMPSELKRKNSKFPAVEDKTSASCSSVLSRRTPTEGKHVSSFGTEVRRGYVDLIAEDGADLALNCGFKPTGKQVKFTVDFSAKKKKRQFARNKTGNSVTRLIREHSKKQFEKSNRNQKVNNFKVEDNITDLKIKGRNKGSEEAMRIHKLCNSEGTGDANLKLNCEEMSSVIGLKSSHTLVLDKVSDSMARFK